MATKDLLEAVDKMVDEPKQPSAEEQKAHINRMSFLSKNVMLVHDLVQLYDNSISIEDVKAVIENKPAMLTRTNVFMIYNFNRAITSMVNNENGWNNSRACCDWLHKLVTENIAIKPGVSKDDGGFGIKLHDALVIDDIYDKAKAVFGVIVEVKPYSKYNEVVAFLAANKILLEAGKGNFRIVNSPLNGQDITHKNFSLIHEDISAKL